MWHAVNSQTTITEICHHVPTMVTHQKTHYTRWLFDEVHIQCVRKKSNQMFFVVSSIELGQFWWNSVHGFLNKFATKICKRFPPHLNIVSTLTCQTWNVHHAGATYHCINVRERNSIIYPISTMASEFARFESSWLQRVGILQEKVYKTRITDLDELKHKQRRERSGPSWITSSLQQPFVSGVVDSCRTVMHVLYTCLAVFPTCCYQLDSNLANFEAIVEMG